MLKTGFVGRVVALMVPFAVGTVVTTAPVEAATLSRSNSFLNLQFNTFPSNPLPFTRVQTSTITLADAVAIADADATAVAPDQAFVNSASAIASGVGEQYQADARAIAAISGLFAIPAGTTFSFGFEAVLQLLTQIDNLELESATSQGELGFYIVDVTNDTVVDLTDITALLERPTIGSFNLGSLISNTEEDTFNLNFGNHTHPLSIQVDAEGDSSLEFVDVSISGRFQRYFATDTTLAVIDAKAVQSNVRAVPAPSLLFGTLVFASMTMRKRFGKSRN